MSENKEQVEEDEEKIEIKAVLLGNSGVGKTNLINTCVGMNFEENTNTSTSGSFVQKNITIDNKNYIINLWDTAGQERYKSITKIFLKKSELVIFVYDITDLNSFKDLPEWITLAKEMIDNDYICAIVGNKSDLYMREQVNEEEAKKFAESKGWQFQLVSAKKNPTTFSVFLKELLEEREGLSKSELKDSSSLLKNELNVRDKKSKCC
jgi:small GTP-binding protein